MLSLCTIVVALAAQAGEVPAVDSAPTPPPAVITDDAAAPVAATMPTPTPAPTPTMASPAADARAAERAAEKAAAEKAAQRQQAVDATVVGVVVANSVSFLALMGGAAVLGTTVPELGVVALALPLVGVPLSVMVTAAFMAPEGEKLAAVTGSLAGHYVGLIGGTIGGALIGAGGGVLLILPLLATGPGNNPGLGLALLAPVFTGGLGAVVGAALGGPAGSGAGVHFTMKMTE